MPESVSYTATLPIGESTARYVAGLLAAERQRRRTRRDRRALGCRDHAVLLLRWLVDGTRVAQLAADSRIGRSTTYRYLHEALAVVAAAAPGLRGALLAARAAGYTHLHLDGTLIRTDRSRAPGPTEGVDLWWSGKHHHHGGNIQMVTGPDGWPLWVSDVRPGREHDTAAYRACPELRTGLGDWVDQTHRVLADLGYEAADPALTTPTKRKGGSLTVDARAANTLHSATRALAERGNALLKTTFKALRRVSLCPRLIGQITAAALVVLHTEHHRTT